MNARSLIDGWLILISVVVVMIACVFCTVGTDINGQTHILDDWRNLWRREGVVTNVVLQLMDTTGAARVAFSSSDGVGMVRRLAIRDDGNRVDVYVDWDSDKDEMTNEVFGVRIPYCAPQAVYFWANPLSPMRAVEEASHE